MLNFGSLLFTTLLLKWIKLRIRINILNFPLSLLLIHVFSTIQFLGKYFIRMLELIKEL